jgi:6-pyruvoyltetrahydropterin/6-carboxytetrahydropterin synthase
MYFLSTECSFDAAHFLKDYKGKCSNLHGHRWRVRAEIMGEALSEETQTRGMLVDFGDLKRDLKLICDMLDHSLIYETGSLRQATLDALREEGFRMNGFPSRPTAEKLAEYICGRLSEKGYRVKRVEVFETPANCAAYEPG